MLTKEQIDEITRLYNSGMSLYKIGKIFNKNHGTIKYHLEKNGIILKNRNQTKTCIVCGKKFKPKNHRQIYCHNPCTSEYHGKARDNALRYLFIKVTRHEFLRRMKDNPSKALQIVNDMIEEEGQEFKDMVLDGMTDSPEFDKLVKTYITYKKVWDKKEQP